jgi:hypothetical protein
MRIAPTLTLADVNTSTDTWAALGLELATTARRTPTRDSATRHPCLQAASFLPCTRPPDFVASRRSSTAAVLQTTDSGLRAFGGLNHLEGFLPLLSEGYNVSTARTSSMADLPLLRKFPLCIRAFYFRCSRTHPHFWERTASVCIIHLYSVFVCLPPPHPLSSSRTIGFSPKIGAIDL